jgi:uncharacterized protein (TIGR03435 family)
MRSRVHKLALAAAALWVAMAAAQSPATFEVASVKANKSGTTQANFSLQGATATFANLPLQGIIQLTYQINQASKLVGAPGWIWTERFDIIAKAPAEVLKEQWRPMMQTLLAERFKLIARIERREIPAYALVRVKSDTLGAALRPFKGMCAGRGVTPPEAATSAVPCGPRPGGPGKLILVGSPISLLTSLLSLMLGRTVVDHTDLAGLYELDLSFAPLPGLPGARPQPVDDTGPSIFTALQEQLGLKLDSERENVDVLVIDRVERPTEN